WCCVECDSGFFQRVFQSAGYCCAHHNCGSGMGAHKLMHGHIGDQLATPNHDQMFRSLRHLGQQVGTHEHGSALLGDVLQQGAHPVNAFWVKAVDGFVED